MTLPEVLALSTFLGIYAALVGILAGLIIWWLGLLVVRGFQTLEWRAIDKALKSIRR